MSPRSAPLGWVTRATSSPALAHNEPLTIPRSLRSQPSSVRNPPPARDHHPVYHSSSGEVIIVGMCPLNDALPFLFAWGTGGSRKEQVEFGSGVGRHPSLTSPSPHLPLKTPQTNVPARSAQRRYVVVRERGPGSLVQRPGVVSKTDHQTSRWLPSTILLLFSS